MSTLDRAAFHAQSRAFLDWLVDWYENLPALPLEQALPDPARAALFSVDLINGFCYTGNLASPRVAAIVDPTAALFRRAYAHGLRHYVLIQEAHSPHAPEFEAFGPHGIAGTPEAETVPALAALPFAGEYFFAHKNSLHTLVDTRAGDWVAQHPEVDTYLVVGDCTDLCTYDLAMDLKLRANAADHPRRVLVPARCVDTYDLPLETAARLGVRPHPGDLMHLIFLYHMALNGIEVLRELS